MPPASPRLPLRPGLLRAAAALLEAGLLLVLGVLFLDGTIQDDTEGPSRLPLRPGLLALPVLLVAGAYAVQRVARPVPHAFPLACALACALGAALRPGLGPLDRAIDGLVGLLTGAFFASVVVRLDGVADELLRGEAKPWNELVFGMLLVTFGAMPSALAGGFVLALPTLSLGLLLLGRCILLDTRAALRQRSPGGAARALLALPLWLLGLGFLVVCPMISLGRLPHP